ncbi:MAG: PPC domain-containing protein, partial [Anaerolinea sp.]|nr:PPC domain-containing protein [Anaerolinea sp.]
TATAVPDLTADFVPYSDEFQGVTLSHPAGWASLNFFFTILASSEALLQSAFEGETPEIGDGALLLIISGAADEFGSDDPETLIDEVMGEFDFAGDALTIIAAPTVTRSNGQETVTVVAKGEADGQEIVVLYAVVINQELGRAALVAGVTGADAEAQQLPILQAIVSTIAVGAGNMAGEFGDLFGSGLAADSEPLPIFLYETTPGEVTGFEPVYFSFSGAPTLAYDIVVTPLTDDLDLVLDLLDENGVSLLDGEVDETFSGAEAIRNFQPADYGLFIVAVRGFAGGAGAIEISLLEAGARQSRLTEPGSELLAQTTIEPDGRAVFRLVLESGGVVTAVVTPLDGIDVVIAIYDEEDALILEVDDAFGEETLLFIAPAAGLYELEVRGFAGAGGSFDTMLLVTPDALLELYDGDLVNGWLDESGATDYAIELTAGQTLTVTAEPEEGFDLVIELQDIDERRLLDVDDGPRGGAETLVYTAAADGMYFIHIRGFAGAANGKFTLTMVVE